MVDKQVIFSTFTCFSHNYVTPISRVNFISVTECCCKQLIFLKLFFQMLVCKSDDESSDEDTSAKKPKDKDKKFQWNHGSTYTCHIHFLGSNLDTVGCSLTGHCFIYYYNSFAVTPPLKNVRKRRFRKTLKKKVCFVLHICEFESFIGQECLFIK